MRHGASSAPFILERVPILSRIKLRFVVGWCTRNEAGSNPHPYVLRFCAKLVIYLLFSEYLMDTGADDDLGLGASLHGIQLRDLSTAALQQLRVDVDAELFGRSADL